MLIIPHPWQFTQIQVRITDLCFFTLNISIHNQISERGFVLVKSHIFGYSVTISNSQSVFRFNYSSLSNGFTQVKKVFKAF